MSNFIQLKIINCVQIFITSNAMNCEQSDCKSVGKTFPSWWNKMVWNEITDCCTTATSIEQPKSRPNLIHKSISTYVRKAQFYYKSFLKKWHSAKVRRKMQAKETNTFQYIKLKFMHKIRYTTKFFFCLYWILHFEIHNYTN